MDTTLRPPIMTTSRTADLIPTVKFTEIGVEGRLVWTVIVAVLVSVICSAFTTFWVVSRLDGQRWVGWTGQSVSMNGKDRKVLIPLFMTPSDLEDLRGNK